jgi:hypothetical protein
MSIHGRRVAARVAKGVNKIESLPEAVAWRSGHTSTCLRGVVCRWDAMISTTTMVDMGEESVGLVMGSALG